MSLQAREMLDSNPGLQIYSSVISLNGLHIYNKDQSVFNFITCVGRALKYICENTYNKLFVQCKVSNSKTVQNWANTYKFRNSPFMDCWKTPLLALLNTVHIAQLLDKVFQLESFYSFIKLAQILDFGDFIFLKNSALRQKPIGVEFETQIDLGEYMYMLTIYAVYSFFLSSSFEAFQTCKT